jgi:hypothetical protein
MAKNKAYREAEKKIEEARQLGATKLDLSLMRLTELPESLGQLIQLQSLDLDRNQLTTLPDWLGQLTKLESLDLSLNRLTELPESLANLNNLKTLNLFSNKFESIPSWIGRLKSLSDLATGNNRISDLPASLASCRNLQTLNLGDTAGGSPLWNLPSCIRGLQKIDLLIAFSCELTSIPDWISEIKELKELSLSSNHLTDLPSSLSQLEHLERLDLDDNPLNPELAAAYQEGLDAVKKYLRAKVGEQIVLNEAKLILIGEGEVGKSCLLGALRGDEWVEGSPTTHGIEIKPVNVTDPDSGTEITMNGWDFGGQKVYRPTHQLFFSAPAVYLVVWKPREGPQQGFVKEWIKLVKHREPDAKVLVVATHGGPGQRQPDVDRQELWDLFGHDTVQDFFLVDSKPDEQTGERHGIAKLKDAIARVAAKLPEMGRTVPASWQQAREALKQTAAAYLPLEQVLEICQKHKMSEEDAQFFVRISHRLGHLIHYEHDPTLQDIVILKPDWLATAISFVLDDKQTRDRHGLVSFTRLGQLWNNPAKEEEFRYPATLHPVFLRLMERFDLSYRVAGLPEKSSSDSTSLIAQLVPDVRPDLVPEWALETAEGDEQQLQICRIVDTQRGQSAAAEGLFYRLIVRLHKYSLGRVNHEKSVHWQRGLVLDDDYNGRALLEHINNDVRITVRAPYPEAFLSVLTREVKWLVEEDIWAGLRCDVMVPCLARQDNGKPCPGLFEVRKLIENKRRNRPEQPCPLCNEWQDIDCLLRNAPAARPTPAEELLGSFAQMKAEVSGVRELLTVQHEASMGRFDKVDSGVQRILSQADAAFTALMQTLTDEAKEGPRLFSFQPVASGFLDLPTWISQKFLLTLWCEHSRLPLPALNKEQDKKKSGVYELELSRDWFVKAAPFLKVLTGTLSLVLPVASSAVKLALDDRVYKGIEKQLDLAHKTIDSVGKGVEKAKDLLGQIPFDVEHGEAIAAQGGVLRQLHALLKQKDPGFGGLIRVQNKRQEFLWVHPQFEKEY